MKITIEVDDTIDESADLKIMIDAIRAVNARYLESVVTKEKEAPDNSGRWDPTAPMHSTKRGRPKKVDSND